MSCLMSCRTSYIFAAGGVLPTQEKKRLRILGNKEILGKISNLGEDIAQHPVPLEKLNPVNSNQKTSKTRYQTFPALSSFTGPLHFVPNTLPRIVGTKFQVKLTIFFGPILPKKDISI